METPIETFMECIHSHVVAHTQQDKPVAGHVLINVTCFEDGVIKILDQV